MTVTKFGKNYHKYHPNTIYFLLLSFYIKGNGLRIYIFSSISLDICPRFANQLRRSRFAYNYLLKGLNLSSMDLTQ